MSRFPAYPRHSRSAERVLGRHAVWGEEGILPPASVSSSQWFARVFSALFRLVVFVCLCLRCLCLRSPPSHNPLPRFQNSFCGIASASDFCIARLRRRSSKGVDALAEMSEARSRMCLPLPPSARAQTKFCGTRETKFSSLAEDLEILAKGTFCSMESLSSVHSTF